MSTTSGMLMINKSATKRKGTACVWGLSFEKGGGSAWRKQIVSKRLFFLLWLIDGRVCLCNSRSEQRLVVPTSFLSQEKFIAFYTGHMNAADVEMYDEFHERFSAALHAGRFLQYHFTLSHFCFSSSSTIIGRLIAFNFARNEEEKWTAIGERVI
eukprot:scaffold874_cov196-Alexandrium_tamarense.AAC.13